MISPNLYNKIVFEGGILLMDSLRGSEKDGKVTQNTLRIFSYIT